RGFSHLSMNIGEDDLFIQRIAKRNNVSVVMIPKGSMMEHPWGGLCWWLGRMRHYGQTWQFYPDWVHSSIQWDLGSQALLFLTAITALIFMPLEFKVATIILLLLRYLIVALRIRSIAKRVGERGAALKYFIFDLMNPILMMCLGIIMLRKDLTAWK
ncbi:MAG: glycosyltransferase, partial [Alistipes sp.]|nr:glycosyltransferase [Alistipes sp.]